MRIPVLWWNSDDSRGSWACTHMLNQMFDLYGCEHSEPALGFTGAIVVVHGGNAQLDGKGPETAEAINESAAPLDWLIVINIGDETSEFPIHLLEHPNMRLWQQTPLPSQLADRYLIEGYTAGTENLHITRDYDWFFAGQLNHDRRRAMKAALDGMPGGKAIYTEGFGQGIAHFEYITWMNRAKVVPCPSGPATPDSFRLWEALECGAVPIVDAQSLNPKTLGFWSVVLGDHPLTIIDDWETLPAVMDAILHDYERQQRLVSYWWKTYKLRFREWLGQDLARLGAV